MRAAIFPPPLVGYGIHTSQIAARTPSPARWGRWRHRASKDARLSTGYGAGWGVARCFDQSDCTTVTANLRRSIPAFRTPSGLRPPSPLRGEGETRNCAKRGRIRGRLAGRALPARGARLYQPVPVSRRFDLLRFVFAALFALLCGAAVADTPQKIAPQSPAQVRLSFAPVVKKARAGGRQRLRLARRDDAAQSAVRRSDLPPASSAAAGARTRACASAGLGRDRRSSGLVVTNHHVIEGMTEVKVALADRREFEAEIVLRDPRTDLAVLQDQGRRPFPGARARRFRRDRGRRFRHRDRRSVRRRPDGDAGHRLGAGAHRRSASTTTASSSRPTRRSIRAIRAARWSISTGGSSASIRRSIRARAAAWGSASPFRSTWSRAWSRPRGAAARRSSGRGSARRCRTCPRTSPNSSVSTGRPERWSSSVAEDRPAAEAGLKRGDVITAIDGQAVDDAESVGFRLGVKPLGGVGAADGAARRQERSICRSSSPRRPRRRRATR